MIDRILMISDADRHAIENKYHKIDEPFDGFNRMNYHGWDCDPATGLTDEEIRSGLAALTAACAGESHAHIKAKAVAYVLDHTRIAVDEHDWFPCLYSWGRLPDDYTVNIWHREAMSKSRKELGTDMIGALFRSGTASFSLDFDHTVPDFDAMMSLGFPGLLARLEDSFQSMEAPTSSQIIFYEAAVCEYQAVIRFTQRLASYAQTKTFLKAARIAASLEQLAIGAPQNTFDALMMIYLYFMISESVEHYQVRSLGYGLDATLYPFYLRDIESGTFTEEEIASFIAYFLLQFSAMGSYWGQPMYLGGTNSDGTTKVNKLTRLILEVYKALDIYNPKLQIKISEYMPKDYLMQALDMVRSGLNSMVFVNEDTVTRALMHQGATYEKAVDSVIKGCYEYVTKADTICISFSTFNALKPVSLVFDRGVDKQTGTIIGIDTGDVTAFTSFEQFYDAYRAQFTHIVGNILDTIRVLERYINEVNPSTLYSGTIGACVKSLTDANNGGIKNVASMWMNGLGTAVDALMAVYELVFETKRTTLVELKNALDADWVGYDALRHAALTCRHKYGNGDRMADSYAGALHALYSAQFAGRKNGHGGHIEYELHSALEFRRQGERTTATPDGRHAGDEVSKNTSPTPGMDKNGITALIASATSFDLSLADSGACLDAMLLPSAVQGEDGLEVLYAVMQTFMRRGGASIHFNIFDADTLRDAQKNPENYKNLQVRVCGWNVLWNNLSCSEQNAYITRAENIS
ncbi:MAG: hypothetical protein E7632_08015 [Ruminococcaceae bacterium]|nr:hypothetical protein [Oscillospiraceae bacterium]